EQAVLADFIREGHLERYLRRARTANALRRDALLAAVDRHFGKDVEVTGSHAGVHMMLWFPKLHASSLPEVVKRAAQAGVGIYSASPHHLGKAERAGVIMGYARLSPEEINEGMRLLGRVVREFRA
ncbi:MAG: PLP-dependent aminotransferase family protein, partial [Bryobacteraceae bacterium]